MSSSVFRVLLLQASGKNVTDFQPIRVARLQVATPRSPWGAGYVTIDSQRVMDGALWNPAACNPLRALRFNFQHPPE